MKKKLQLLFVADPIEYFDPVAETTLYLMAEAQRRGHSVFVVTPQNLSSRGSHVWGQVQKVEIQRRKKPWYRIISTTKRQLSKFDAVFLRKDPPFDVNYLYHLQLLNMVASEVYCMNHPQGILIANEKLSPLAFSDRIPETLISAQFEELREFVNAHPQGTILKPLGEAGGSGVFFLRSPKSENIRVILESLSHGFTRHVIAQAYLSEGKKGDKRILLLGQEVLGAFARKPAAGEHRANLHAGGTAKKASLSQADLALVKRIQPMLAELHLDFVGLDVIGDFLIEINVTSPMGIHELNLTAQIKSEKAVLDYLESRV